MCLCIELSCIFELTSYRCLTSIIASLLIAGDAARQHAKTPSLAAVVPPPVLVGTDASTGVAATFAAVEMTTTMTTTIPPAPPVCPVIRPASAATRIARIRASEYCRLIRSFMCSIKYTSSHHKSNPFFYCPSFLLQELLREQMFQQEQLR